MWKFYLSIIFYYLFVTLKVWIWGGHTCKARKDIKIQWEFIAKFTYHLYRWYAIFSNTIFYTINSVSCSVSTKKKNDPKSQLTWEEDLIRYVNPCFPINFYYSEVNVNKNDNLWKKIQNFPQQPRCFDHTCGSQSFASIQ